MRHMQSFNENTVDRNAIQKEVDQLAKEITRIADTTEFNTKTLLNGKAMGSGALKFHIGANKDQSVTLDIGKMDAATLLVGSGSGESVTGIKVDTQSGANDAIETINDAINTVSNERSKLGAMQNRLEHTIKNLDNSAENLQAAESRVRDVDMAKEMMEFTKQNILQQAATAMLAQANSLPQGVLQLLK